MDSETDSMIICCVHDDKFMPKFSTLEQMQKVAQECKELARLRSEFRSSKDVEDAYRLAIDCLMYNKFGNLWLEGDAMHPKYQVMKTFYVSDVEPAIRMHQAKLWDDADQFEISLNKVFCSLEALYERSYKEQTSVLDTVASVGWSALRYLPVVAQLAPTVVPIAIVSSVLINELGFVRTVDVATKAARLGINVCNISARSLALVVNITSRLI